MRRSLGIEKELAQTATIQGLTAVFESIASIRIAKVKDRAATSQAFFSELWQIYTQLRVDRNTRLGNRKYIGHQAKPNVFLVLTSEGALSGDIDERIIREVINQYDPNTTDLVVVGAHGATQLASNNINVKQYFRLPDVDQALDVGPIVAQLIDYAHPSVFYQKYVSLAVQEVDRIDLLAHVQALGEESEQTGEVISPREYLFEPSIETVVGYLESVMLEIAIGQVILQSRLAQYASRFNAMYAANTTAKDLETELGMRYRRAKRAESDERTKEVINAMINQ
jgi:F-type H+-transporting ATPase subunit gamma